MGAAMYMSVIGLFMVAWVESLYPKCRGKTYGRLPLGKRRMEAPKIERQHHEII